MKYISRILPLALALAFAPAIHAGEAAATASPLEFSGMGFLTVAGGKILGSGEKRDVSGWSCPCFVSDYAQGGLYEEGKSATVKPDSKLGLQGKATAYKGFSVTGQVVFRGARDGKPNLEWVYGAYDVNDNLALQVGRKRLPLLFYSESQDIGVAYPWVHLPGQVYGWEIVNYNGANLLYRDQWGPWSGTVNVFGGSETNKDNGYWKIYNGKKSKTDSKWTGIAGAELVMSKDWFEGRLGYIQSKVQNRPVKDALEQQVLDDEGNAAGYSDQVQQKIYAGSANIDYHNWVVRGEYIYIDRKKANETDISKMIALGYRIGKLLPMLSWADYHYGLPHGYVTGSETIEAHRVTSLVLRYDLTTSSAVKLQYDQWKDRGDENYRTTLPYGDSKLISLSYDMTF